MSTTNAKTHGKQLSNTWRQPTRRNPQMLPDDSPAHRQISIAKKKFTAGSTLRPTSQEQRAWAPREKQAKQGFGSFHIIAGNA